MKFAPEVKGCRFWGFEPASCTELLNGNNTLEQRKAAREKIKAERAAIKAAGFESSRSGFKAKIAAVSIATHVEKATGIEMHVFNHDYL